MPRYDYDCETCEICVEISKSYKDVDREEKCDKCGSIMKRLISKSNFALRGDGWHSKDYSPDNKNKLTEEKA